MSFHQPNFSDYVRDFSFGFMDSVETDTMPLGATPDARNWFLAPVMEARDGGETGRRAVLRKRKAAESLSPVPMASEQTVDLLFWFVPENGSAQLLAACNAVLYRYDTSNQVFVSVGALTGFLPGTPIFALQFKDNVLLTDGHAMLRYTGSALLPMGLTAPGLPTLTAVTPGGLPNTAIYESFVVWYDSTMDHESSPSPVTATITMSGTNGTRRHGRPASPPSNATHWRVYVRRVDTSELNFFRTGVDQPVATLTYDEAASDTARRIAGPRPNENDPPPSSPPFLAVGVFKDYGIGIKPHQSYYAVSKLGDLESWHPSDVFALERGAGKPLRSVTAFREDVLLQKPNKTWRLDGDRPPFRAIPVHSEYGNVGKQSAIEVERVLYGWDEQKGPYRTDLTEWEPLGTNRLMRLLGELNRDELENIQVEVDPANTLVVWAVPASGRTQPRRRHLLAFNYRLSVWLPPVTGLEYACLCRYQPIGEALSLYAGDYWGRVYRLFQTNREGLPATATVTFQVLSATTSTVTVDTLGGTVALYTTGAGLAGLMALVVSPSGAYHWRRIRSNTADTITLDTLHDQMFSTVPDSTWTLHLGAVQAYWTVPWVDHRRPELLKRGGFLFVEGRSSVAHDVVTVQLRVNQSLSLESTWDFGMGAGGMLWGVDLWGVGAWGGGQTRGMHKQRINRTYYSAQLRVQSYLADTPVDITGVGLESDARPRKRVV